MAHNGLSFSDLIYKKQFFYKHKIILDLYGCGFFLLYQAGIFATASGAKKG